MSVKVSVIIPNYNHERFLTQRIESVINQTYQDFELIILDDCSTDNSRDIIEQYREHPKVKCIVYNSENSGSTFKQWNKGVNLAEGEYIWIAESDDYCELNFLETAIICMKKNDAQLFYAISSRVNNKGDEIDQLKWWYADLGFERWQNSFSNTTIDEINYYTLYKCTIVNTSAAVFKNNRFISDILRDLDNFIYAGDWFFWLQYLQKTNNLVYSVSTRNYFRFHENTTRSYIPYKRNIEIFKIYNWCCNNLIKKNNNLALLKYYFKYHIFPYPRKQFINNSLLLLESLKYTWRFAPILTKYYFTGRK